MMRKFLAITAGAAMLYSGALLSTGAAAQSNKMTAQPRDTTAQYTVLQPLALKVPNEEDILSKILADDSPYYYPAMMMRYLTGEGSLTAEHYYYLYYGYAYDDAYDAHREMTGDGAIHDILARNPNPTREEALALVEATKENMLADPFSPGNLNMMAFAYHSAGDTLGAVMAAERYRGVMAAIRASGTGVKESSPWHILRFSHASDMAAAEGLHIANRQVRTLDVEYLQFDKNRRGVKGWFFNFERVYWKPFDGKPKTPKARWMFNGTPIGRRKRSF